MRKKRYMKHSMICIIVFSFLIYMTGCYQIREKNYYKDKSNFITEEALVDHIIYDETNNSIYFWLSEIDVSYQDHTFKIKGDSVNILLEKDILRKIETGSEITYTSAPHYFGDGYCMPIVALSYNGEELLSFEEGYENLMELY